MELRSLALERPQLEEVRRQLAAQIRLGLAREGEQLRALLAYLPPPEPGLEGRALVVDTGGTNMRAAVVSLAGARSRIELGPLKQKVPTGREGVAVEASDFFGAHRALVSALGPPPGLPVGYCFSFPTEVQPNADARLIAWTKSFQVQGVEGTLVGSALWTALAAGALAPGQVRVLNDTVAALLGGALAGGGGEGPAPERCIGLIVGTGTNMAGFFSPAQIPKLADPSWRRPMAVNLESGNYHPPHLSAVDERFDQSTDNPGRQRFEKAVSGYYLPFLFQSIRPAPAGFDATRGSAALAELRDGADREDARLAGLILDRSADLVAAGLAAVIDLYDQGGPVGILAEGGLFWGVEGYRLRVERTLSGLLGRPGAFVIRRIEEANLIGAAVAALSAI